MRRLLRSLLVVGLVIGAVPVTATPCLACDCALRPIGELLADADAAFVGEVVSQRAAIDGTIQVLRVDGVYQGELGPRVELFSRIGRDVVDACAVLLPTGTRVAVVATRNPDGTLSTDSCALTTPRALREAAGPPRSPDPAIGLGPTPIPPVPSPTGGLPWWVVAGLGAVLGAALIGARLAADRRRVPGEAILGDPSPGEDDPDADLDGPDAPAG